MIATRRMPEPLRLTRARLAVERAAEAEMAAADAGDTDTHARAVRAREYAEAVLATVRTTMRPRRAS